MLAGFAIGFEINLFVNIFHKLFLSHVIAEPDRIPYLLICTVG
jgi:hypothetical protein